MEFVSERDVVSRRAAPASFTDGVWQAELLPGVQPDGLRASRFSYPPGARSAWHVHHGEQALLVVSGHGVVVQWGESTGTVVGPGDLVHVLPGEKHWHGATSDNTFVHVAVTASGPTEWLEHVSDEEYGEVVGHRPG